MPEVIESKTFDEIRPGDTASSERSFASADLRAWSVFSGASDGQAAVGLATSLFSSPAESRLPGPGSVLRSIAVDINGPMKPGSAKTTLVVKSKVPDRRVVILDGTCADATGGIIASAVLEVEPSSSKVRQATAEHCLDRLVDECRGLKPILTGVVYPCSAGALGGAIDAAKDGLITPVLFGPEKEIKAVAAKVNLDISGFKIVDVSDPAEAAHAAAIAAGSGEIQALMKGSLHTDVLLHAVLDKEAKLRTGRLLSHCALISAPQYARRVG